MDVELPVLSSSQESVGKLFDSNLPSNYCYGFFQECGVGEFGEGGEVTDYERELQEAEKQAMESGSITPLVKQELKLVIQSRRLSQGKDELRVGFVQPSSHQLTEAEEHRRVRRKEQNRRAAKRFRQNKKFRESILLEEVGMLESKNRELKVKVTELQRLKAQLLERLTGHAVQCHALLYPPSVTPPPPPSPSPLYPSTSNSTATATAPPLPLPLSLK